MAYPYEKQIDDINNKSHHDADLHDDLRDAIHSMFCIPTLRHLSFKQTTNWQAFTPHPIADESRIATSNVISLSLPTSFPLSRDLKEILTWPKGLRYMYHANVDILGDYSPVSSAKDFITALHPQRHTRGASLRWRRLLWHWRDYVWHGAQRIPSSEAPISVERNPISYEVNSVPNLLHETLPPNVKEVWIGLWQETLSNEEAQNSARESLWGFAMDKVW